MSACCVDLRKLLCFILALTLATLLPCSYAFADNEEIGQNDCQIVSGDGNAQNPYVYHFGKGAKVAWKHIGSLNDSNTVDRYECLAEDGSLSYGWIFAGGDIPNPSGPFPLEVNYYTGADGCASLPGGADAVYFSTANKRDLGGKASLILAVPDSYADGQTLALFYYGGFSDAMPHGMPNPVDPQEYTTTDDVCAGSNSLVVENGYVTAPITYGGNFFLIDADQASSITCTAVMPATATNALPDAPSATNAAATPDTSADDTAAQANSNSLAGWQLALCIIIGIAVIGAAICLVMLIKNRRKHV